MKMFIWSKWISKLFLYWNNWN